jgi:hypothetical protein
MVMEAVCLVRDPSITAVAITWHTSAFEIGTRGVSALRELIYRVADDFVTDYMTANRS